MSKLITDPRPCAQPFRLTDKRQKKAVTADGGDCLFGHTLCLCACVSVFGRPLCDDCCWVVCRSTTRRVRCLISKQKCHSTSHMSRVNEWSGVAWSMFVRVSHGCARRPARVGNVGKSVGQTRSGISVTQVAVPGPGFVVCASLYACACVFVHCFIYVRVSLCCSPFAEGSFAQCRPSTR